MGPMMGPPPGEAADKNREQKPKNIKEVPGFLTRLIKNFFSRLFYIFSLVWETRPWILFALLFIAVIQGFMPVIKSLVAAGILNELTAVIVAKSAERKRQDLPLRSSLPRASSTI